MNPTQTYTISGKVTDQFGKTIKSEKRFITNQAELDRDPSARARFRFEFVDDTKAQVWIDPANKVNAEADGSYSLTVKGPGPFQITAGYTGGDGNYKNSDPQTAKIDGTPTNIPLKYGYTTTVSGTTYYEASPGATLRRQGGATVIIETDYGTKIREGTSDPSGNYSIKVSHAGKFTNKSECGSSCENSIPVMNH